MNVASRVELLAYSALIPALFTTAAHFTASARIKASNSAGVLASMAGLASKAERLECIADIRDACQPAPSVDRGE